MPTIAERAIRRVLLARRFESRMIPTSVGRVHVLSARGGGERAIAFFHGFGASSAQLAPVLLSVAPHFRDTYAFDLPAHGFSDAPEPLTEETMGRGLEEVVERTLDRKVILFGNSMGGYVALRLALARSDLVERLVLCSPGGAAMTDAELATLRSTFRIESHRDAVEFLGRLFARKPKLVHLYALGVRRKLSDRRLQALLGSVTPETFFTPEELAPLAAETLILWGRQDRILPKSGLEFFRRHLPNARFEEIDGFGHSPHLEAPRRIAQKIIAFARE